MQAAGVRDVNSQRLRYFEEVVARGSIRGAADALNTAPSVITRQLRLLEEELGALLFTKHARGMMPTDAAAHLLEYGRACRAEREALEERLAGARDLHTGEVRLAMSEGFLDEFADEVLLPFRRAHPGVQIVADVLSADQAIAALLEERIHVGIAYNPPAVPLLRCYASCLQPLLLLVRPGHPLCRAKPPVTLAAALGFPIGITQSGYGIGKAIEVACYAEGLTFTPALTTNSFHLLRRFVADEDAVVFGSANSVRREIAAGDITAIPVAQPLLEAGTTRILVKAGRPLSAATRDVLERFLSMLRQFKRH